MKEKGTILLKRLIAGLLLAMFLFVQVIKFLHHHDRAQSIPQTTSKGLQVSSPYSDCSVCDYQIAKDSHHLNAFFSIQKVTEAHSAYTFSHTPLITSTRSTPRGRGPPSLG